MIDHTLRALSPPQLTQYEAWLSMQSVTPDGLRASTAEERQARYIRISNANEALVESVRSTWASKTPREAHKVGPGRF